MRENYVNRNKKHDTEAHKKLIMMMNMAYFNKHQAVLTGHSNAITRVLQPRKQKGTGRVLQEPIHDSPISWLYLPCIFPTHIPGASFTETSLNSICHSFPTILPMWNGQRYASCKERPTVFNDFTVCKSQQCLLHSLYPFSSRIGTFRKKLSDNSYDNEHSFHSWL